MPHRKLLAKIHIAKKELALEEETYRSMLENLTGKRSAKNLDDRQIIVVINHLKGLGWKQKETRGRAPQDTGATTVGDTETRGNSEKYEDQRTNDPYAASPQIKRKIEAMWHDIYRGNSETLHLRQFLRNHFKVSDIRFLDKRKAYECVEALKKIQERRSG